MAKKLTLLPLLAIILTSQANLGIDSIKTSTVNYYYPSSVGDRFADESIQYRNKRQTQPANLQFWTGVEGKAAGPHFNYNIKFTPDRSVNDNIELPFWANRGRRNSLSEERFVGQEYPTSKVADTNDNNCKQCLTKSYKNYSSNNKHPLIENTLGYIHPSKNREKRSTSESIDVKNLPYIFWHSRGRRQEDDPFWAPRGRRQDDPSFWEALGRRENMIYGKNSVINDRNDEREPFWGNRGRREESGQLAGSRTKLEEKPVVWGTRVREEPFWGNKGRNQNKEQFWDSRGRRDDSDNNDPFWGNRGGRDDNDAVLRKTLANKLHLKDVIQDAMDMVEQNIAILSNKQVDIDKKREQSTVASLIFNNRFFAEQPRFVVMDDKERNPFFGSRGKKKMFSNNMVPSSRDRRGSIEEIVKSVRNDPYFIARGKKESFKTNIENSTAIRNKLNNARNLICSTVNLITETNINNKFKRDIEDSERDRRTILKKLAAQLQIDPYFVSRGKKSESSNNMVQLEEFINAILNRCE